MENDPQERLLYQRAIVLLNEEFIKRGFRPTIGVETEFYAFDEDDKSRVPPVPRWQLDDIRARINRTLRSLEDHILFRREPINDIYHEKAPHVCEVATNPVYADKAADVIEQVQSHTLKAMKENGYDTNVHALDDNNVTPGLHTSIGFLTEDRGRRIDAFNGTATGTNPSPALEQVAQHMKPALAQLTLLFAPNSDSYGRYRSMGPAKPGEISVSTAKNKSGIRLASDHHPLIHHVYHISHRIENRLPGADTPVYKAILGTMLAAFDAMERAVERDAHQKPATDELGRLKGLSLPLPPDTKLPTSIEQSFAAFETSKPLWDILDRLAPGQTLGAQLFEHECARYQQIAIGDGTVDRGKS